MNLETIKKEIEKKLICELKNNSTNMVFGKGKETADILFIGEAPGAKEDLQGIPFVGAAGKQLDKLLNNIGLESKDVYIANILKYRPPKNRNPNKEEIMNHTPYLIKQIEIIKPKIIVTLGNFSTKFVLANFNVEGMKKIEGITQLHGSIKQIIKYKVMPMYHPAAMLYNPKLRETIKEDFQKLGKYIENN